MPNSSKEVAVSHQRSRTSPLGFRFSGLNRLSVTYYLLLGATLLAPASMITAMSCGLNCSTRCEQNSLAVICSDLPASTCLDGGTEYQCAVGTGCHCASLTSSNLYPTDCNVAACDVSKDRSECLTKPGCAWGDACQDLVDCHSFDSNQGACNANEHQCHWSRDC